ncbi:MAG: ribonuclease HII [Aeropyrum sp.]|nr:ribonuclease HII [Aeropyrum sp.]
MAGVEVGVDEAGRGSVVGELVVAAYAARTSEKRLLEEIGVRDSKVLTAARRLYIYRDLKGVGFFTVQAIPAREIDRENINRLVTRAIARLVSRVMAHYGYLPTSIVIDRYGDEGGVVDALTALGVQRSSIIVEEKADTKYPVVSAASIVAKVVRDARIEVLRRLHGVRGSGYPSDPETREWLAEVFRRGGRPSYVRYSWETVKKLGGPWIGRKRGARARTLDEFLGV